MGTIFYEVKPPLAVVGCGVLSALPIMVLRQNLLALVTAYGKATKLSPATVSKKFYGNGDFIDGFRAGDKSISIDKYDEVVEAIRSAWPPSAEWPHLRAYIIARPKRKSVPSYNGRPVARESRIV